MNSYREVLIEISEVLLNIQNLMKSTDTYNNLTEKI